MGQEKNRQLKKQREQQRQRRKILLGSGLVIAVAAVVAFVLLWPSAPDDWELLVEGGRPALAQIETPDNQGADHLPTGTRIPYDSRFPTSGAHWPSPTRPGFYETPQPNEGLVHAIEHGNINVYYDELRPEDEATLREWTSFYSGTWSAVNAIPAEGLGHGVVLTAWDHRLRLDDFDAAPMAAFIEAFRGRGPENPVR